MSFSLEFWVVRGYRCRFRGSGMFSIGVVFVVFVDMLRLFLLSETLFFCLSLGV